MNNLFPTSISPDAAALDILERMPVMEHDDIEDKLAFAISSHGMNDKTSTGSVPDSATDCSSSRRSTSISWTSRINTTGFSP